MAKDIPLSLFGHTTVAQLMCIELMVPEISCLFLVMLFITVVAQLSLPRTCEHGSR